MRVRYYHSALHIFIRVPTRVRVRYTYVCRRVTWFTDIIFTIIHNTYAGGQLLSLCASPRSPDPMQILYGFSICYIYEYIVRISHDTISKDRGQQPNSRYWDASLVRVTKSSDGSCICTVTVNTWKTIILYGAIVTLVMRASIYTGVRCQCSGIHYALPFPCHPAATAVAPNVNRLPEA